ncbi:MAG: iron chelate uptake ABC transporter family permease subunit [Paracoccaceae bacterium]
MVDEFLVRAFLAGLGLTLATGPLGSFVVWRRMAYFGDATSHAAILGVALSFAFHLPLTLGILAVAVAVALIVSHLAGRGHQIDTALGVMAHSALALGLVAVSFLPQVRVDLSTYLFGDILTVGWNDVGWVWAGSFAVAGLLCWRWPGLITATVNEELAEASGVNTRAERLALTLALALTVALSIKIVGALLIAAMLIIPAATAQRAARSPEAMAIGASLIGALSVALGLGLSLGYDTPAGPSIIVVAFGLFLLSLARPGGAR